MKPFSDTYAGWTSSEAAVLAACSVILVIFIISVVLTTMLVRFMRKHSTPELNRYVAGQVGRQFKFYKRTFKRGYYDGYNKEKDRYYE
jgi:membrane protein implicated in regulation of membrane protease activity